MNLHSLYDAASNWSVVRLPRCEIELPFHCHHHVCYGFLSIILLNLKVLSFSRLPHGPFPLPSPHHLSGILVLGSGFSTLPLMQPTIVLEVLVTVLLSELSLRLFVSKSFQSLLFPLKCSVIILCECCMLLCSYIFTQPWHL